MVDQDGLVQVGSELMLGESMAQDNTGQEDLFLRLNPEVALGAAAAVHEHPLHQISPMRDRAIPAGSEPDHGGSAPPRPLDMSQLVEILANIQNQLKGDLQSRMDANAQHMKNECEWMQKMEERMGSRMDANVQEMNENMQALRGDMQNVVRNFFKWDQDST